METDPSEEYIESLLRMKQSSPQRSCSGWTTPHASAPPSTGRCWTCPEGPRQRLYRRRARRSSPDHQTSLMQLGSRRDLGKQDHGGGLQEAPRHPGSAHSSLYLPFEEPRESGMTRSVVRWNQYLLELQNITISKALSGSGTMVTTLSLFPITIVLWVLCACWLPLIRPSSMKLAVRTSVTLAMIV